MAALTKDSSALLDKLISDSITFGLHIDEALEYVGRNFGQISERTYYRRRAKLVSEEATNSWLSYHTRIGFVELHRRLYERLEMIMQDSINRLYEEQKKSVGKRDENLILKIKKDIRENTEMLVAVGLGTPILASVKSKLEKALYRLDDRHSTLSSTGRIN